VAACRRAGQVLHAALDERPVPAAALLVLRRDQHPLVIHAGGQAGQVEAERAGEGVNVRMRRRFRLQQQLGQAQRVRPKERADRVLRVAAVVALIEQQVEGLKDRHPAVIDVPEVVHVGRAAELAEAGRSVALDPEPVRMPM
jgi:hypothetical protein